VPSWSLSTNVDLFSIGSGGPITAGRAFINDWQNDRQPSRQWLGELMGESRGWLTNNGEGREMVESECPISDPPSW
jgi:hypothetical protein